MTDARHTQLSEVLLGQSGQMGALDLMLLESLPVFGQVDAGQPVAYVILVPQVEGLLVERPKGEQRGRHAWWRGGRGRATPRTGAPHDEAHFFRFVRETEARRLKDGGGCDGRSGQTKAPDGSQRIWAVRGTGAGRPPGHWVAAAWSDGVGGAVASLRDSMELPQTAEESKSREQRKEKRKRERGWKSTFLRETAGMSSEIQWLSCPVLVTASAMLGLYALS